MQNVIEIVNLTCIVASLLFIWFKTDAFVSYSDALGILKPLLRSYFNTVNLSFPQFLYITYKNSNNRVLRFVIKLITCPVCLSLWLSLITCTLGNCMLLTFTVYIFSLLLYFILERVML
jgi:hypothetical protein